MRNKVSSSKTNERAFYLSVPVLRAWCTFDIRYMVTVILNGELHSPQNGRGTV